jgi:hypothetical protein
MLLVLLLGIADFGRVFSAGITVEAAARNAAEIAAEEYLDAPPGNPPRPLSNPAPLPGDIDYNGDTYYPALHDVAAKAACDELRLLPNAGYDAATSTCSGIIVQVCVHDGADPSCSAAPTGFADASAHPGCVLSNSTALDPTSSAEQSTLRYAEVRICYRFSALFEADLRLPRGGGLSLGEVHLERTRSFTVADW